MSMRIALAAAFLGLLGTASADTKKPEDKPAPPPPVAQKCTVTKIAGKDQKLEVAYTAKAGFDLKCKTESKKVAEKWAADNAVCEADKKTFKYTVAYGDDKTFELAGNCPKPEKPEKKSAKPTK